MSRKSQGTIKLMRALVRDEREHSEMVALTKLREHEVIRADVVRKWSMRAGECLGVFDLRAFGPNRSDWVGGLKRVTEQGASVAIVEKDGSAGLVCADPSGAEIIAYTMSRIHGENTMKPGQAKAMADRRHAVPAEGRMPDGLAKKIWRDKRRYPKIGDALAAMPGWTQAAAYRTHGKRDDTPGRKPAPRKRK